MKVPTLDEEHVTNLRKKALLGTMDILILHWTKKQPLCGKDIRDRIQTEFGLNIGSGTMYPILYQLENKGFIEARVYNKKKMYSLTKEGRKISKKVVKEYFKIQIPILNILK